MGRATLRDAATLLLTGSSFLLLIFLGCLL